MDNRQDSMSEAIKKAVLATRENINENKNKSEVEDKYKVIRGINNKTCGCALCNYTGLIEDAKTGLILQCDCQLSEYTLKKKRDGRAPKLTVNDMDKLRAIVPLEFRNTEFDSDRLKHDLSNLANTQNIRVYRYNNYIDTINTILAQISVSELKNSYIIGAPNDFGKSTFVYTALKRLIALDKKVVPYLSLVELAELKVEYENRLVDKLKNPRFSEPLRRGKDEVIWKDITDADVLFTRLSSVDSKYVESMVLSALMRLRGSKGKPTIVMAYTPLDPYINDEKLRSLYWDDMLSYTGKEENTKVDRLIHRACYKRDGVRIQAQKGVDY